MRGLVWFGFWVLCISEIIQYLSYSGTGFLKWSDYSVQTRICSTLYLCSVFSFGNENFKKIHFE